MANRQIEHDWTIVNGQKQLHGPFWPPLLQSPSSGDTMQKHDFMISAATLWPTLIKYKCKMCKMCVCVPCLRLGHVHTNPANNLQTIFQTVVGLGLSSSLEALHNFLLLFLPISLLPVTGSAFASAGNKSLPAHNRARSWDRMNKAWGIWKCMLETHPLLSKGKGIDSIDGPCSIRSFFPLLRLWLLPAQRTFTGCCPRDHVHSICFKLFQSAHKTDSPNRTVGQHVSSPEFPTTRARCSLAAQQTRLSAPSISRSNFIGGARVHNQQTRTTAQHTQTIANADHMLISNSEISEAMQSKDRTVSTLKMKSNPKPMESMESVPERHPFVVPSSEQLMQHLKHLKTTVCSPR